MVAFYSRIQANLRRGSWDRGGRWSATAETSSGPETRVSFGAAWRETVVTFRPTDLYGIADVDHAADSAGDDLFIGDIEDALSLWGVQYRREARMGPVNP